MMNSTQYKQLASALSALLIKIESSELPEKAFSAEIEVLVDVVDHITPELVTTVAQERPNLKN